MGKIKVSIIIPARNEERYLKRAINSVRIQKYFPIEIIVVVNNSSDMTFKIAKCYADKVLNFSKNIGVSAARNNGAKIAKGDVFIFLDADSQLSKNAIEKIVDSTRLNILGSCLGKAEEGSSLKGKLFILLKNYVHWLKIYKGVIDGVLFCHRHIFFKIKGFDETKYVAEFKDFIERAIKAGGKYKFLINCYSIISLRRYEKKGYFQIILFWIKWRIASFFNKKEEHKLSKKYFEQQ